MDKSYSYIILNTCTIYAHCMEVVMLRRNSADALKSSSEDQQNESKVADSKHSFFNPSLEKKINDLEFLSELVVNFYEQKNIVANMSLDDSSEENSIPNQELIKAKNKLQMYMEKLDEYEKIWADLFKKHSSSQFPLQEIWRVLIDGRLHGYDNPFIFDNNREEGVRTYEGEKGYLNAMINTFFYMLKTIDEPLSIERIINLHDMTVKNVSNIASKNGLRDQISFFEFLPGKNMTLAGLRQLKEKYGSFVRLHWEGDKDPFAEVELPDEKNQEEEESFEFRLTYDHLMRVDPLWEKKSMEENKGEIKKFIENQLGLIINEFNEAIVEAKQEDKLKIIAEFIHKLDLLHPFQDGNVRTFVFILANQLLIKHGFSVGIFNEPNAFDGCSCNQLTNMLSDSVEQGKVLQKQHQEEMRLEKNTKLYGSTSQ